MNEQGMGERGAWPGKRRGSRAILHDEVGEFCEDLTEQYAGWLVEIANQAPDGQWRVVAQEQPLQLVSYQAGDGQFDIRIVLGHGSETFAHVVPGVHMLDFTTSDAGAAEELRMQSGEGMTAVRFRSPGGS